MFGKIDSMVVRVRVSDSMLETLREMFILSRGVLTCLWPSHGEF